MRRFPVLGIALTAFVMALLGACSSGESETGSDAEASGTVEIIEPADAATKITDGIIVVDVRTPEEYAAGHVTGALNANLQDATAFEDALADLDPSQPVLVYCRTGNRSATAAEQMVDLGFKTVYDAQAFDALASAGVDVTTDDN